LPKYVTPHWEIGPNVHLNPNPVQGNSVYRRNRRGFGYGVGYVGFPYYGEPFSFGNAWDWNDDSDVGPQQAQPTAPAGPDYGPQEPYPQGPYGNEGYYPAPPRPAYQPGPAAPSAQESAAMQSDGLDHPAITLVFNDGRPPEKVQSYVLTGSSLLVADPGHQRQIPIADLNLPATVEQNREAGVDFELPGKSR
jgi:hypothetical protein